MQPDACCESLPAVRDWHIVVVANRETHDSRRALGYTETSDRMNSSHNHLMVMFKEFRKL